MEAFPGMKTGSEEGDASIADAASVGGYLIKSSSSRRIENRWNDARVTSPVTSRGSVIEEDRNRRRR